MPTINRVPKALLSLLDGQTMGDNPKDLGSTVQPILDLQPHYLSGKGWELVTGQTGTLAVGSTGQVSPVLVPSGEYWFVGAIGCFVSLPTAALERVLLTPTWGISLAPSVSVGLSEATMLQIDASSHVKTAHSFNPLLTVVSGQVLAWDSGTEHSAILTVTTYLRIVRFQA